MRRRELIIALGFAIVWPIAANGQQDNRALRGQILLMQAECIADKLAEFIKQNQNQVGWTTQLPSAGVPIEQRRFDALRLLRQAPAVTELSLLDAEGKEFYKASRLAIDVVGSGTDYSKEPKFTQTVAKMIYYGPVYLRGESEPYMTLGMAGTRTDAGVSVVELNLTSIWILCNRQRSAIEVSPMLLTPGVASLRIQISACVSLCAICHLSPKCRRRAPRQL
jgi:hypothetical protein